MTTTIKRPRTLVGDVFEIVLNKGGKRYMQYIGFDKTTYGFGGDVIRIFKKTYSQTVNPSLDEIVSDEVDFYAHIHRVSIGTKAGLWSRLGNIKTNLGMKPLFYQGPSRVAIGDFKGDEWILWEMDGKDWKATKDEVLESSANMGGVMPPKWAEERVQTGKYQITDPHYIK
jgi:hypothetical protein